LSKSTSVTNSVKVHRVVAGLTQEQLAEKLGVSRQTIVAIEKEKYSPSLEYAFKIARVLGKSIEELFHYPSESKEDSHE